MWIKKFSKFYPNVSKEAIWQAWADIGSWPKWDKELQYCEIKADFIAGTHFFWRLKKGPKVQLTLTKVHENHQFTDCCQFLGAKMFDDHQLFTEKNVCAN